MTTFCSGDLRSVSPYNELSFSILGTELRSNPTAKVTIEAAGGLIQDLWIPTASEIAVRSVQNKTAKKPKEVCLSRQEMKFDVLNFHFVVSLETGPFVAAQAVVVERKANTFQNILRGLSENLGMFGNHSKRLRYIFSICLHRLPQPHAECSITSTFLNTWPPYYSRRRSKTLRLERGQYEHSFGGMHNSREVHQQRAIRQWAQEKCKAHTKQIRDGVRFLIQSVRFALVLSKTYDNLCVLVGFLNRFLSMTSLPALPPDENSAINIICGEDEIRKAGEDLQWDHFGGVPLRLEPEYTSKVLFKAFRGKCYYSDDCDTSFESYMLRLEPEYISKVLFKAFRGKCYYSDDCDKSFESYMPDPDTDPSSPL